MTNATITPQELRIGNWLTANSPQMQVRAINKHEVELYMPESNADTFTYEISQLRGIPLSEEVLIACGFEKDGFGAYNKDISRIRGFFKMLVFAGDYLYQREGSEGKRRETDDMCVLWNKDFRNCFYLHNLMNLYFSLTGEELTYNPQG